MALEPELPSDALFEILTRSSLETVARCRSISKELNEVTYESSFNKLLCERANIVSGFFIDSLVNCQHLSTFVSLNSTNANSTPALSLDFLEVPVQIEAANQGLLVCVSQNNRYLVCKPTTKQWVKIRNPKTKYQTASTALLVLKSNPLKYKIIRFSKAKELLKMNSQLWRHLRCEIFDSTTGAWKRSKDVTLPYPDVFFANKEDSVVAANGGLHWLLSSNQVFAFYEDTENWELFSLPPSAIDSTTSYNELLLVEYQGRLALIRNGKDCMLMWVMENYSRKLWKRQTLDINKLSEEEIHVSPLAFHNGDVALMHSYYKVIFYNFRERKSHKIRCRDPPNRIFKFQSDMEEVSLKGPDRGSTKFLIQFKSVVPYLFLLAPVLGVLFMYCSSE